jgi:hypothetical protein
MIWLRFLITSRTGNKQTTKTSSLTGKRCLLIILTCLCPLIGNAMGSSAASSGGGPVQTAKRGGGPKSSGFFANLHPSRWTRGSSGGSGSASASSSPSSSSNSANNNNNNNPLGSSHGHHHHTQYVTLQHTGMSITSSSSSSSRAGGGGSLGGAPSYKEQVKAWLKEQSSAFTSKYCVNNNGKAVGGTDGNGGGGKGGIGDNTGASGIEVLPKLNEIISNLRQVSWLIYSTQTMFCSKLNVP